MNPKTCPQCGKWFPGLGDLMYHVEQEHIHKSKKQIEKEEISNNSPKPTESTEHTKPEKKDASTQTSS